MTISEQIFAGKPRARSASFIPTFKSSRLQRKCACGGTAGPSGECEQCRQKRLLQQPDAAVRSGTTANDTAYPSSNRGGACAPTPQTSSSPRVSPDFTKILILPSRLPTRLCAESSPTSPPLLDVVQAKLAIGRVNDPLEDEADRIADQVMRLPAVEFPGGAELPRLGHKCSGFNHDEKSQPLQTKLVLSPKPAADEAPDVVYEVLRESGQPLDTATRAFFDPRFGYDFSQVRVHTDRHAVESAISMGASAYTVGSNIVFASGHFDPVTFSGRRLLAHELTHVMQQRAAPRIQGRSVNENGERHLQSNELHIGTANHLVQRWPGDGMQPPGDCSWATYLILRGSVETAKAVVSMLGACSAGDNCLTLATKIAAISAEIAARVALDTTCFKGGDTGHRQQVQDKINMMIRCNRFFSDSDCPPELIAAMAVVVERAREVIAEAALGVAIALVVALIAAIIALAEVIAALAAEAAAFAAAAEAVIALLIAIRDELA